MCSNYTKSKLYRDVRKAGTEKIWQETRHLLSVTAIATNDSENTINFRYRTLRARVRLALGRFLNGVQAVFK